MELPQDLKNYKAPLGAFQMIAPEIAGGCIAFAAFLALVFRDYLNVWMR